jgi:hypothetical protein
MFMTKYHWWAITIILTISFTDTHLVTEWKQDAVIMEKTK